MTYRDELAAAHARIEALEQQLASTDSVRETHATQVRAEAAREHGEELRTLRAQLATLEQALREQQEVVAAQRDQSNAARLTAESNMESQRAVQAAEGERAKALLEATEQAGEVRLSVAIQERQQAEDELVELAGLTRAAGLRVYRERLVAVTKECAQLAAEREAPAELRADATTEEQVRFAMAQRAVEMKQRVDEKLAEREARLARICAALERTLQE
ncbi:MAG: hypothetical protein IPL19_08790 [Sandaracinaceae bacterium]|nr:hypothetical protein [Sandaracinaceae bacterium]